MTITYTDNPEHDSAMRDLEYEKFTDSRPTCDVCGQPITDTHYFEYNGEKVLRFTYIGE